MKEKLVIGNWKMNKTFEQADDLIGDIFDLLKGFHKTTEVVICPPSLYLELATDYADAEDSNFRIGAQNCSEYKNGAYTGEISAEMLSEMEVEFCIVGHSERRKYFGETDETVAKKVDRLIEQNIIPVVCCGEQLEERKAGNILKSLRNRSKSLCSIYRQIISSTLLSHTSRCGQSEPVRPRLRRRQRRCTLLSARLSRNSMARMWLITFIYCMAAAVTPKTLSNCFRSKMLTADSSVARP